MPSLMPLLIALHLLSAVVWVGGMFLAYVVLRPVAASLFEPPQRLRLWDQVFRRFFSWVWLSILLLLITGYAMVFAVFGGFSTIGTHIHLMQALGIVMILLYMHLFFAPFKKLKEAVIIEDWPAAGVQLNQMRRIIGINLILGLIVVIVGSAGRYW